MAWGAAAWGSLGASAALLAVSVALYAHPAAAQPEPAPSAPEDAAVAEPPPKVPPPASASQPPKGAEPPKPPPSYPPDADPPIDSDDKRPLPDYDGREEATSAGDVLLWVPRVLFSPLYLVSEYVVRRPLGALVTMAERDNWVDAVQDFFTFGPSDNMGLVPTGLIDFGLRPSVGLYYFWNSAGHPKNNIRARVAYGGNDWRSASLTDRVELDQDTDIALRASFLQRPDHVFYGLGPRSEGPDPRYRRDDIEARLAFSVYLSGRPPRPPTSWAAQPSESRLFAAVGVRDSSFNIQHDCCDDVSVQSQVDAGRFPAPAGSLDGYTIAFEQLELIFDSRKRREKLFDQEASDWAPPHGTGARLALRGEHAAGLRKATPTLAETTNQRHAWLSYGASLGGYWDVSGAQRVVGLQLIVDFVDPLLSGSEIPFTEQVSLGGARPMRGFLEGRLVDRSSAVMRFEYTWPVWVWLDGAFTYELGNVFGEHLAGLAAELLRQSAGLGIRAVGARDHVFELLVAFGTRPFVEGAEPDSLRFVLGATSGF